MRCCVLLLFALIMFSANAQMPAVAPPDATCPHPEVHFSARTSPPFAEASKGQDAFGIEVSYDLDGSGQAKNVSLVSPSPSSRFDAAFLRAINQSRFTKGVIGTACRFAPVFCGQYCL